MEEPSVLDYVKAKLTFWKKSSLQLPDPGDLRKESPQPIPAEEDASRTAAPVRTAAQPAAARLPWLTILALLLALAAQLLIEPPGRNWQVAMAIYAFSAGCLSVAAWRGEISLAVGRGDTARVSPDETQAHSGGEGLLITHWLVSAAVLTLAVIIVLVGVNPGVKGSNGFIPGGVRVFLAAVALVAGLGIAGIGISLLAPRKTAPMTLNGKIVAPVLVILVLVLATFLSFRGNLFTGPNLVLWLVTLLFTIATVARLNPRVWWPALKARVQQPITLRVDLFTLLLVAVVGVALYFRLSNLNGLPAEMFSDHAEKLLDVSDVLSGKYSTFFERNTGREFFQFYWTALMALVFKTGISFMSLKIGTVLAGLITLYYIYRLGDELGGKWVGLYSFFFAAIAYWPNIISRIGLRFPLYAFAVAPVFFYLLRGLRRGSRNDFIWAGLWLGLGLHGYTASRIIPLAVLAAFALYWLHRQSRGQRAGALVWLGVLALVSFIVFIPLFHYALDNPGMFNYRSFTRMGSLEQPLPGPAVVIFFSNLWNALVMFFWDNGDVWVHSIPGRPALAVVDAALFFGGAVLVAVRYIKRFHWRDLYLLISIPILLLPSVLSLAFPNENPNLNRTAGVYVVVFVIVGLAFDALLRAVRDRLGGKRGLAVALVSGSILALLSLGANHNLFFVQYAKEFRQGAWNSSEMGAVMRGFSQVVGTPDTSWVVGYPHWVDTRLVAITAGYPQRNPETFADRIEETASDPRAKLYLLNTADVDTLKALQARFPDGRYWLHKSSLEGKDFIIFTVPAAEDMMP